MQLPDFSACRILVVGDVMLDRYLWGSVSRISPEAPVPIVKIERQEDRLGGAANVAKNIASLGGQVTLMGVVGGDYEAGILRDLVDQAGIRAHLHADKQVRTTVKTRVVAQHQQMLRMDVDGAPSHEIVAEWMWCDFRSYMASHDVVVLSDYAKGVLNDANAFIHAAKAAGRPVLVDPKAADWLKYSRADLIKPNLDEMHQQLGRKPTSDDDELQLVDRKRQSLRAGAILVTKGAAGMTMYAPGLGNCVAVHQPALAREVFDVSGAGDTVMAVMALMRAAGANSIDAMKAASAAAGIVVGRVGTSSVTRLELEEALSHA